MIEKLAECKLAFHDAIVNVVEDLPDEDFAPLVAACRRHSLPGGHANFPMPEWEEIAQIIQAELDMRRVMRKAEKYMSETGTKYYCLHCDGTCTPEHLAEYEDK